MCQPWVMTALDQVSQPLSLQERVCVCVCANAHVAFLALPYWREGPIVSFVLCCRVFLGT